MGKTKIETQPIKWQGCTVAPGTYYLGDPCYSFNHERWMEILNDSSFLDEPYVSKDGVIVAFSTMYGDGVYKDQYKNSFPVDTGMIGLVPVKMAEREMEGYVIKVTFAKPVDCRRSESGQLCFGKHKIETA
jgi:hypothetical protein